MSNVEVVHFNPLNSNDFYFELKRCLLLAFDVETLNGLPENYGVDKSWSLLNLLQNGGFDSYTLLYVDGVFWSGCGGRIIQFKDQPAYQCGVRMFTNPNVNIQGLVRPAYTMQHSIMYQLERAVIASVPRALMTFNEHRYDLFRMMGKYLLNPRKNKVPNSLLAFHPLNEQHLVNNSMQWVMELELL